MARSVIPFSPNRGVSRVRADLAPYLGPLGPADKLTQAERWLGNVERNLTRRIMSREENIAVALQVS